MKVFLLGVSLQNPNLQNQVRKLLALLLAQYQALLLSKKNVATGLRISSDTNSFQSPMKTKQSQQSSPFSAPRVQKYHDEEDNWSVASSAATSRTVRSRVTVGVAPSFKSAQRAAQRKEFYEKLEQKHQALKAERMEYEARTKEEQEEAIKQMRKSMVVKANPVPSFYRQGPPPKVELKKLPLTRAKSPKLSRRKSCGDTTHSSAHEEALCSRVRHSIGTYKPGSATSSPIKLTHGRTINGISKPKDRTTKQPSTTPNGSPLKLSKETNSDITVQS
uniref:protein WAVE-DAMPENED 2-like isoform X1 n=1 Tax=Erigeron canadensis TaxID=72917 RepID=UPI001CB93D35|nr:protein WAVE-DAMPENED 2-like isoform X1 [Erigeron canadensis]